MAAQAKKKWMLLKHFLALGIVGVFSLFHRIPPAWAEENSRPVTQREAMAALDQKLDAVIKLLSDEGKVNPDLKTMLKDLDTVIDEYTGSPRMTAKMTMMPEQNNIQK